MKRATRQKFPPGWNDKQALAVIAHYDQQTEEEAATEIETAPKAAGETWMSVPVELVEVVTRLIEDHAKTGTPVPSPNLKKKSRTNKRKAKP